VFAFLLRPARAEDALPVEEAVEVWTRLMVATPKSNGEKADKSVTVKDEFMAKEDLFEPPMVYHPVQIAPNKELPQFTRLNNPQHRFQTLKLQRPLKPATAKATETSNCKLSQNRHPAPTTTPMPQTQTASQKLNVAHQASTQQRQAASETRQEGIQISTQPFTFFLELTFFC